MERFAIQTGGVRLICAVFLICLWGCQTTYYAVWEKLGKEKRHLLRDEVENARNDQQAASEQFKDVLTRIKELYGFSGGELEEFYERLRADYEACEDRAEVVKQRIENVERIGRDLFSEWEAEIDQISNVKLKFKSAQSLRLTRQRYNKLQAAMNRAESSLDPVLNDLNDYVLYLKHNLNARSIGALRQEVKDIESDVGSLLNDIGVSIREAEGFLKTFH